MTDTPVPPPALMPETPKPCPFCGGPAGDCDPRAGTVACKDRSCAGFYIVASRKEWNRRSAPPDAGRAPTTDEPRIEACATELAKRIGDGAHYADPPMIARCLREFFTETGPARPVTQKEINDLCYWRMTGYELAGWFNMRLNVASPSPDAALRAAVRAEAIEECAAFVERWNDAYPLGDAMARRLDVLACELRAKSPAPSLTPEKNVEAVRVMEFMGSAARTALHVLTMSNEQVDAMYGRSFTAAEAVAELRGAVQTWETFRMTGALSGSSREARQAEREESE